MNKYFLTLGLLAGLGFGCVAQNKNAIKFGQTITKDNAYKHLSVLASDEYEGRETGKKGAWMAAEYIRNHFRKIGLKGPVNGDYFQKIDMIKSSIGQGILTINGQPAEYLKDFYFNPTSLSAEGFTFNANSILFAGYGIKTDNYNEFAGQNVAGKVVLIFASGTPGDKANVGGANATLPKKLAYLGEQNAAAVIVIDPRVDKFGASQWGYLKAGREILLTDEVVAARKAKKTPVVVVGTSVGNTLLAGAKTNIEDVKKKISDSGQPASQEITIPVSASAVVKETPLRAENVLGFLPGSDPKLKDEVLVITGHYDHIGIDSTLKGDMINNGADDDGSGTTGVLMIAEAFAKAKKAGNGPKRSILFMTVVGEEKGLLGSEWYSEHPIFPLANTIANLNIDMIGRGDEKHKDDNNFVYIIGSDMLSSDLDRIGKKANADYVNIKLDETYNNRTDPNRFYYRSDHYNFAKHGIPVIFYFNGVHPEYHQPGDEISKIDFPMLAKRARLVYFTAWELANGAKRPVVDKNDDGTPKTK
ncbi:peptidase [Pedobacter yulinensis]|uniref:Peptidase n=1 Tax=Pedobacter yulinensis TaxID=2126353 RepID=A0A2T3HP59_9SPHI|nr:M28 family peptidase [Pedobacter yulinensis]PST84216.1 peptidase [Pedobacter yulinensis]